MLRRGPGLQRALDQLLQGFSVRVSSSEKRLRTSPFKLSISKRSLLLDSGAKSLDFATFSSILAFPAQPHTSSPSFSSEIHFHLLKLLKPTLNVYNLLVQSPFDLFQFLAATLQFSAFQPFQQTDYISPWQPVFPRKAFLLKIVFHKQAWTLNLGCDISDAQPHDW